MHSPSTGIRAANAELTEEECLLWDLVNMPSPSGEEQTAVRFLVEWMQTHGYDDAHIDEVGNAVGIIGNGSRDVVLLGHIDTFAGNPAVYVDGRRLFGRGSVDAKGPLCAFAVAASKARLPADVRLIVVGAVEEEATSSKGARHIRTQYQPQMCIIGEPSNWDRITLGYKGQLMLEWRWEGPLAHSAGQTPSPAEQAVAYWQQVQRYVMAANSGASSLFQELDATLQEMNSGQNGAYGWAQMTVGFRLPPGRLPEEIANALIPSDDATVRAYGQETAFIGEKDSALSRAFRRAIRRQGGRPRFVYKTGTSDMNVVGPAWKCPTLAYGPGDSSLDHTPQEHIDLDEYVHAIATLTDTLELL